MPSSSITVSNKNRFSSDGVWLLRILVLIQLIFLGGLIIFNVEQFIQKPKPVYFPIKKSDQLVDNIPLDQPTLTEGELLNWVTEAMIVSFSFNYHNYDKITAKINGAWIEKDNYAFSKFKTYSVPKQWFYGCSKSRPITWSYKLDLRKKKK